MRRQPGHPSKFWRGAATGAAFLFFLGSAAGGHPLVPAQSPVEASSQQRDVFGERAIDAAYAVAEKLTKAAVRELKSKAESGDKDAQALLGLAYDCGCGTRQDFAKAVLWLRRAAEQNHPVAQCVLGTRYRKGRGVLRDNAEAMRWYRRAADQGLPEAQNNLAFMYQEQRNFAEAEKWYLKAAESGDFFPAVHLAQLAYVRRDYPSMYFWALLASQAVCPKGESCLSTRSKSERELFALVLQAAAWPLSAQEQREARQKAAQWLEAHQQPVTKELAAAKAPLSDEMQLPDSFGLYLVEGNLLKDASESHPDMAGVPSDFTIASLARLRAERSEEFHRIYDACYRLSGEPTFILFHEQVKPEALRLESSTPPHAALEIVPIQNKPFMYRVTARPPLRPNVYFLSAALEGEGPLAGRKFLNCFAMNITFSEWSALMSGQPVPPRQTHADFASAKTAAVVSRGARSSSGESWAWGPFASTNRAAKDVERQLERWGRYALVSDPSEADLVFIITEWDEMDVVGIKRITDRLEVVAGGPSWRENTQNPLWSKQRKQPFLQLSESAGFLVRALRKELEKTEKQ